MDYQVEKSVIVNGVRRRRGDVLTGADAKAVEASPLIRARCVPYRYSQQAQTAPSKAPSSSAPKAAAGKE